MYMKNSNNLNNTQKLKKNYPFANYPLNDGCMF